MRRFLTSFVCAIALVFGGATVASAATGSDSYAPSPPTAPSLSGSTVSPACSADVPWITYSIVRTDPDDVATDHTVRLVLSDSTHSESFVLGDLVDGRLSGSLLWPGASVGEDGRGDGWPGWTLSGNEWVQTDEGYAWTRGEITATIEVNQNLSVPLSYPPSTPDCLTAPLSAGVTTAGLSLPSTGGDASAYVPFLWAGGALVIGGGTLLLVRRTRRSRD